MSRDKKLPTIPSQLLDLVPKAEERTSYSRYYDEDCTKAIRQLIAKLIDKRIIESIKKTDDVTQLTSPSYSEMQAYQSGYRQAISDLKDLINR